jgi:hypothetical protein
MHLQAEQRRTPVEAALYSAEVLCSPEQIRSLSHEAGHLLREQEDTRHPCFFLASVDENAWAPIVVVVARAKSTVGIVYAKERKFAGIPSGLIYADATLGTMVVAAPADREPVLRAALERWIDRAGTRGLRVVVPATGFERDAIYRFLELRPLDVHYTSVKNHCNLDLPPAYDTFIENLGRTTRRNFRYYRRQSEHLGNTYFAEVPLAEFRRAAFDLFQKSVLGAERHAIDRALGMLAAVSRPILVGLRHKHGEWLSIMGGWYEFDRAVVCFQLNNDYDYARSSVCTVLRGYLIEDLIARNVPSLLFWGGIVGPHLRYCRYLPAVCAHLDVPTFTWRTLRGLIGWSSGFLPQRFRLSANFVAPRVSHEHDEMD